MTVIFSDTDAGPIASQIIEDDDEIKESILEIVSERIATHLDTIYLELKDTYEYKTENKKILRILKEMVEYDNSLTKYVKNKDMWFSLDKSKMTDSKEIKELIIKIIREQSFTDTNSIKVILKDNYNFKITKEDLQKFIDELVQEEIFFIYKRNGIINYYTEDNKSELDRMFPGD